MMEMIDLKNQGWFDYKTIGESTISKYFLRLNSSDYAEVSKLFSSQGYLYPPFGKSVCGKEEITQYLNAEATGMIAEPESVTASAEENGNLSYQVKGKVKTSFFTVNVSWTIVLNPEKEILSVKVKLLNELQDLLALKKTVQ
jgi:Nuclear transport factor 2 (NTF2) domain